VGIRDLEGMEARGLPLNQALDVKLNLVRQMEKLERGIVPAVTIRTRCEALLFRRLAPEDRESLQAQLGPITTLSIRGQCAIVGGGTGQVGLTHTFGRHLHDALVPSESPYRPSFIPFFDSHHGKMVTHSQWYAFDDGMCLTGGADGRLCVWDVEERTVATEFTHPSGVRGCAFSPHLSTATLILSASDELRLCDLVTGSCAQVIGEGVHELRQAYSHQTRFLHPLHRPTAPTLTNDSLSLSLTRQQTQYSSIASVTAALSAFDPARAPSSSRRAEQALVGSHVWSCAWHPTRENLVFSGDASGTVRCWDIRGGGLGSSRTPVMMLDLEAQPYGYHDFGLASDGVAARILSTYDRPEYFEELNVDGSGSHGGTPRVHAGGVCQILLASTSMHSSHGRVTSSSSSQSDHDLRAITTGVDGRVRLWGGRDLHPMPIHIGPTNNRHWYQKSALSADAQYLFYPESDTVRVFDLYRAASDFAVYDTSLQERSVAYNTSPLLARLRAHIDRVLCVAVADLPEHSTKEYYSIQRPSDEDSSPKQLALEWVEDDRMRRATELCRALRDAGYICDELSLTQESGANLHRILQLRRELDETCNSPPARKGEEQPSYDSRIWSRMQSFVPRAVSGCAGGMIVRWSAMGVGDAGLDSFDPSEIRSDSAETDSRSSAKYSSLLKHTNLTLTQRQALALGQDTWSEDDYDDHGPDIEDPKVGSRAPRQRRGTRRKLSEQTSTTAGAQALPASRIYHVEWTE